MATQPTVLDDLDDATAQLIIRMHLEDMRGGDASQNLEDAETARQLYEDDLKSYSSLRGFLEEEDGEQEAHQPAPPPSPPAAEVPPPPIATFECSACGDDNTREHSYQAPCGHEYCADCLTSLFTTSMTDERFFPPRCCTQVVPFETAREHIDDEVESKFEGKRDELADPNKVYCAVPTCSTYIPPEDRAEDLARCPGCLAATCLICRGASHEGECPEDVGAQSALEAARKEGWQRCFPCRRVVELTIGCNHITCFCRAEFCYECGERWKTCACDHFREAFLLERAQEIADREGGEAAGIAERLRQRHECERGVHDFEQVRGVGPFQCDGCDGQISVRVATTKRGRSKPHINRCRVCHLDLCNRCRNNLAR